MAILIFHSHQPYARVPFSPYSHQYLLFLVFLFFIFYFFSKFDLFHLFKETCCHIHTSSQHSSNCWWKLFLPSRFLRI
jgi:hypothetical protein